MAGLLKTVNAHLVVRLVGEILKVFFKTVQVHAHLVVELVGEILEVFFKTVHAHLVVRLVGGDFVAGLLNVEDQSLSLEVLNPKIKPTIGKIKVILRILILTQSDPDHLSRITLKLIFFPDSGHNNFMTDPDPKHKNYPDQQPCYPSCKCIQAYFNYLTARELSVNSILMASLASLSKPVRPVM